MCVQEVKYPQETSQLGVLPTSFGLLFMSPERLILFVKPVVSLVFIDQNMVALVVVVAKYTWPGKGGGGDGQMTGQAGLTPVR